MISEGIRSGVNWMREKSTDSVFANSFAASVFATPGTPSISTWPSAMIAAMSRSIICSCPTMIFPISLLMPFTASCSRLRSILF